METRSSVARWRRFLLLLTSGTLLFIAAGCKIAKYVHTRKDMGRLTAYGVLSGSVANLPAAGVSTYILAFSGGPDDPQMVEWERVQESGLYFVTVKSGSEYQVAAFADLNGDRRWESGEPADIVAPVRVEPMAEEEAAKPIRMFLRSDVSIPPNMLLEVPGDITNEETTVPALGEVVSLDDPCFSPEAGRTGYWEPYKFLKTCRFGIFFTEEYDPKRIPVLFIYGARGSPQDWRFIMEHMDRSRFQAWFLNYASGIRLENWSMGLNSLIKRLHVRTPFRKLHVVAHSMGGLLARDFILRNTLDDQETYITRFVSISTPWAGQKAAAWGVWLERFPMSVVVPSWNDIEPKSSFIVSLFQRKLPPSVSYYLIYGYLHSERTGVEDTDGVVRVVSELAQPACSEAQDVFGLMYSHSTILAAPETLRKLEECLSD
jgi:pimeloyl-ACP methyl ester carboxylesterase